MEVCTPRTPRDCRRRRRRRRRRRAGRFVLALSRGETSSTTALQLIELRKTHARSRALFLRGPSFTRNIAAFGTAARNRYRFRFSPLFPLSLFLSFSLPLSFRYFFSRWRYVEIQNDRRPQRYECNNRAR